MRHERQVELLRRLQGADAPRPGPLGPASMHNPAAAYTSPERLRRRAARPVRRPCRCWPGCRARWRARLVPHHHGRGGAGGRRAPGRRLA